MRSLSDLEDRPGHLSPGQESLSPMAAMVGIGEISGSAEEIGDWLMSGQEPLRLAW